MSSIKRNSSSMNKLLKTLDSPSITNTVENDTAQSQGQSQVEVEVQNQGQSQVQVQNQGQGQGSG